MKTPKPTTQTKALNLTSSFEGGGKLAGNFDGQTLSWGALQWNIGKGTLLPLLRRIYTLDAQSVTTILGTTFTSKVLADNDTLKAWATAHVLEKSGSPKASFVDKFAVLSKTPASKQGQLEAAKAYLERATLDCLRLGFESERAYAFMFDVAVQNGGIRDAHVTDYLPLVTLNDDEEWERLKLLAFCVARNANPKWQSDVRSRKQTIAVRTGTVHGKAYDIERDFGISHLATWY